MDKTLFNTTLPVVITDLQQASSQLRPTQIAARQAKSKRMDDLQFSAAQWPRTTRGSLPQSFSRDSLASSSSSLESEVHPDILSYPRAGSLE